MKIINRDPAHPVLGIRRVGGFNFGQQVGAGGFSVVFKERARCGWPVAVKVDSVRLRAGEYKNRFIDREAAVLSELDHPNIIKCLGHGKCFPRRIKSSEQRSDLAKVMSRDRRSFLALEYLGNYRKANEFVKGAADRVGSALFIIEKTALALAYLHDKGLIHADIKPDNIFVNGANVKVIDFASARPEGQRIEPETEYWVMGTRGYLSLSRLKHNPPTKADDLFALGMTAAELCLGDLWMEHFHLAAVGDKINGSNLPEPVKELLFRMIGVAGWTQFANAQELLEFIGRVRTTGV